MVTRLVATITALTLVCLAMAPVSALAGGPPQYCPPPPCSPQPQYCAPPPCRPSSPMLLCGGILSGCSGILGAVITIPGAIMRGLLAPPAPPAPCGPPAMCRPPMYAPVCYPPPARITKCKPTAPCPAPTGYAPIRRGPFPRISSPIPETPMLPGKSILRTQLVSLPLKMVGGSLTAPGKASSQYVSLAQKPEKESPAVLATYW